MLPQDPRTRPSCFEIMRLTEILLAQAKRRSDHSAAHQQAQGSGTEIKRSGAGKEIVHLRRASSEGQPVDKHPLQ